MSEWEKLVRDLIQDGEEVDPTKFIELEVETG